MQKYKAFQILLMTIWIVFGSISLSIAIAPPTGIIVTHEKDNAFDVSWKPSEDKDIMGYGYQLDSSPVVSWTNGTKTSVRVAGKGLHHFCICSINTVGEISFYATAVIDYSFNTSKEQIGSSSTYQAGAWPAGMAVGDINGDNLNDIVCANYNDNTISVFIQDNNGRLSEQATYSTFLNPLGVGIGDIDLDGRNEISVVCAGADIMNIFGQAVIIDGSITIKYGTTTLDGTISLSGVKTFSGEIKVEGEQSGSIWISSDNLCLFQLKQGTSTLFGSCTLSEQSSEPVRLIGEIKASDGMAAYTGKITLKKETGGHLINIANYATERAPYGLSMGDINGDGRNDIVVANLGAESISIFTWLANIPRSYSYLYHSFAFAKKMILRLEGDKIFAYIVYPVDKMPFGIDIGDMNMDGLQDMACVNYQSGNMNVFLQENGILKPSGTITTGPNPTSVKCGDINSDGMAEIVTSSLGGGSLSIFTPAGLIGTYTTHDARSGGVDVGDINNDGRQDVAVSNDTSNTVSVFIQGKDDRLNSQTSCKTGTSPGSCKIADINNDGINEVITADAQSNTITVHYFVHSK